MHTNVFSGMRIKTEFLAVTLSNSSLLVRVHDVLVVFLLLCFTIYNSTTEQLTGVFGFLI
jgi:hypothetical protein